jgi:O-antigen/teichoic acid export membrane protein
MTSAKTTTLGWLGVIVARLLVPLASFFITVLVARFWGKSVLAQYATIWAWLAISQYFSLFGLPDYIAKEAGRCPQDAAKCLKHGLIFIGCISCLAALLVAVWAKHSGYSPEIKRCLILAGVSLPACACSAMCQAVCTAIKKMSYVVIGLFTEAVIFLSGGLVVIFLGGALTSLIAVLLAARVLTAAGYLIVIKTKVFPVFPSFEWPFGRGLLAGAGIFGITWVCGLVFMRLDIAVLSLFCSMSLLGPYSAAAKVNELWLILPLSFYFVNLAPTAHFFQASPATPPLALQRGVMELFYVVFAVVGGGMFFAETALSLLYGPAYASAAWILRLLLVGFFVMSAEAPLSMTCQAAGFHKVAMWIAFGRLATGLACQLLFVRKWGVAGAPCAILATMTLSFVATYMVVEKRVTHFNWLAILSKPALACAFAASVVLLLPPRCPVSLGVASFLTSYFTAIALLEGWHRALLQKRIPLPD